MEKVHHRRTVIRVSLKRKKKKKRLGEKQKLHKRLLLVKARQNQVARGNRHRARDCWWLGRCADSEESLHWLQVTPRWPPCEHFINCTPDTPAIRNRQTLKKNFFFIFLF